MKILTSHFELRDLVPNGATVANAIISRKRGNTYHAGHEEVIKEARKKGDIVTLTIANCRPMQNAISPIVEATLNWDRLIFYDWVRQFKNKIDYILDINDGTEVLNGFDVPAAVSLFESECSLRGYEFALPAYKENIKMRFVWALALKQHGVPKTYIIDCWKDGYHLFCFKDLMKRHLDINVVLIDPITDSDSIPLSSSLTDSNKIKIKRLHALIAKVNNKKDIVRVTGKIKSDPEIEVGRAGYHTKFLGSNKYFLEVPTRVDTTRTFYNYCDHGDENV